VEERQQRHRRPPRAGSVGRDVSPPFVSAVVDQSTRSRVRFQSGNPRDFAVKARKHRRWPIGRKLVFCRTFLGGSGSPPSACHAEGRGFESLQPLSKRPAFAGRFRGRSRVVRLRHRTMTGQSCPRRLADAVGRCSLAGDSERPAPWNFCVPAEDRDRPRRVGAPAHRHPSALSVVAMLPSSRSSKLNLRSRSSSDARASAGSAATPASAQERHSCRDRRECSSHGGAALSRGSSPGVPPLQVDPTLVCR
jgi:hypothetical protein